MAEIDEMNEKISIISNDNAAKGQEIARLYVRKDCLLISTSLDQEKRTDKALKPRLGLDQTIW